MRNPIICTHVCKRRINKPWILVNYATYQLSCDREAQSQTNLFKYFYFLPIYLNDSLCLCFNVIETSAKWWIIWSINCQKIVKKIPTSSPKSKGIWFNFTDDKENKYSHLIRIMLLNNNKQYRKHLVKHLAKY